MEAFYVDVLGLGFGYPGLDQFEGSLVATARGQPGTQAVRGWPGYGRPTVDPWMAWVCSGPTGDPGHPRMARATQG